MIAVEDLARALALSHAQVEEALASDEDADALARRLGLPADHATALVTARSSGKKKRGK